MYYYYYYCDVGKEQEGRVISTCKGEETCLFPRLRDSVQMGTSNIRRNIGGTIASVVIRSGRADAECPTRTTRPPLSLADGALWRSGFTLEHDESEYNPCPDTHIYYHRKAIILFITFTFTFRLTSTNSTQSGNMAVPSLKPRVIHPLGDELRSLDHCSGTARSVGVRLLALSDIRAA